MAWLLDTNIAISIREKDGATIRRVKALPGPAYISVITRVELEGGVYTDPENAQTRRERLDDILKLFPTLPFDERSSDAYRDIVRACGYSRRKVLDRMIAAQAVVARLSLVTFNAADFRDVPDLNVLAW